jgi:hypothetical protein
MIHIATVHWMTDRWIDVQLHYLQKHIDRPFRVYACVDGVEQDRSDRFFFSCSLGDTKHAEKLNHLARQIASSAAADDLIVFLDGDAFPISPLAQPLDDLVAEHPLAAIRRDENMGDRQPHPSFCVTTVSFWQEIEGDWSRGPTWLNDQGETVDDVGGKVLKALEERRIGWTPILRTNVRELHPILFGVYGDLIYHHGAGFRWPLSRRDIAQIPYASEAAKFERGTPEYREYWGLRKKKRKENERLSELVFERIENDDDFARELFLTPPAKS